MRPATDLATKGVFVTGTDTGVGKTYVSCLLVRALRRRGLDVGVLKPVSTGDRFDARRLRAAAGVDDSLDDVNPFHFRRPLAPSIAARLEHRRVSFPPILRVARRLAARHEFLLAEGVGGWLVPLNDRETVADLAAALGFPVLVVARPTLGTINHTRLTVESIHRRGLRVLGIVVNYARPWKRGLAERTAPAELGRAAPVVAVIPWRARRIELPRGFG